MSKMQSAKLTGRELFNKIGCPSKIVAPMVDQSELGYRILTRRYGAELCYTPMIHAKLFATNDKYVRDMWSPKDGDEELDRPLVAQFCANDPNYLLAAAKKIEDKCDAVDLNLGCPQGIAKKGHYGSFLMEDWDLISKLIRTLHENLKIPVTAKIRIYESKEKSLEYARMVLESGAQFLTVHGRLREMKGQLTGLANWDTIKYIRDNLPQDTVFFSNGNVLYPDDIERCLETVRCDGVMSAEGVLYNPALFTKSKEWTEQYPRVDHMIREYFEIVKALPADSAAASKRAMKSHFFKILINFLPHYPELRIKIGKSSSTFNFDSFEAIVQEIEAIVEGIYRQTDIGELDRVTEGPTESWGGSYKKVPFWRCQPYFRVVNGMNGEEVVKQNLVVGQNSQGQIDIQSRAGSARGGAQEATAQEANAQGGPAGTQGGPAGAQGGHSEGKEAKGETATEHSTKRKCTAPDAPTQAKKQK